ncbi:MAG: hypothetical protein ACREJM_07165 [Candidatus Saccharimonadales bacterium]
MKLPILILVSADSIEANALGQEVMKSNPSIEQAMYEGVKYVMVFSSVDEANRYIDSRKLHHKRRAIPIATPHEFVSVFGQLADEGFGGVITDFASKGIPAFDPLDLYLGAMRAALHHDAGRQHA